ncbi:PEGA domain-containing protein [Sorangium sp. So ce513]|uniref:PEGA domain-containing protein n=1 Tax=Sorangium sp. So ce513 TaxID=3133315 RepID=UPI003F5E33C5
MRRVAQSLGICLMLGIAIGFAPPIRAEDRAPAPARSDGSALKEHLRSAKRARAQGRWTEATGAYKAALEAADAASATVRERAEIAGELGLCELALREYRDAAEHLAWSLEQGLEHHDALSHAQYERFSKGLRKAEAFVGTLIVAVDPPDAEVIVDGTPLGRTARAHRLFLKPGQRTVRLLATGRAEALHVIQAVAGARHEISTELPRAAASSAKETTPATPTPVSAAPAARAEVPRPLSSSSWPGALRIAGIGLTTASASFGVLFMVHARGADGDLAELNGKLDELGVTSWACREPSPPATCSELSRLRRQRDQFAALGTGLVVASGVLAAATIASFFTDFGLGQAEPRRDNVALSPMAAPGQIGLVAHGAW